MIREERINMLGCTKISQMIVMSMILYFTGIAWIIITIDFEIDHQYTDDDIFSEKLRKYDWLLRTIPPKYIFLIFTIGNLLSGSVGCCILERIHDNDNTKYCIDNILYFYICASSLTLSFFAIKYLTLSSISFTIISHYLFCALLISIRSDNNRNIDEHLAKDNFYNLL